MSRQLLLWITLTFIVLGCNLEKNQDEEVKGLETERLNRSIDRQEGEETGFHLQWGAKKIVMYKYPNSAFKGGGEIVDLNEFLNIIQTPLELYKKEESVPFKIINIHRTSFEAGLPRFWQPYPNLMNKRLGPKVIKEIKEKVGIGNGVQMRMFSPVDSTDFYISLYINDPFADYEPAMKVRSNYFSQVFGFQLIQKEDRPAILRLDTNQVSTKHVLGLFKENSAYKILHIPNFSTRRRMWRGDLFYNKDIAKTLLLDNEYDLLMLPEYVDYMPRQIVFKWGKMESRLNSENYTYSFFRKNIQKDYQLIAGGKQLNIKGGHIIIASGETKPECIITGNLNHPEVVKRLFRLGGGFSVYLDRLVVEDKQGRIYHFPEGFAFHIEKSKEFELELSETQQQKEVEKVIEPFENGVKITLNTIPLKDLLSYLLDLEEKDILLNGFDAKLLFDIYFASSSIDEHAAKKLILTKLQHHIKFALEPLEQEPLLALRIDDLSLLKKTQDKGKEYKFRFSEDQGVKEIELSQTTITELANLIAYDMNVPVANLTNLEGHYDFNLTYEDTTDLTKQLQAYGLLLDWYFEEVKIIVSKY